VRPILGAKPRELDAISEKRPASCAAKSKTAKPSVSLVRRTGREERSRPAFGERLADVGDDLRRREAPLLPGGSRGAL